jgi:pyridoxamine 5'-phosphate oxidase
MKEDLSSYRKSYEKSELLESNIPENPLQLFRTWFLEAKNSNLVEEVNAMTLTTNGLDGFPKGRVVLLKEYNENGFVFYTNYDSAKGKAIATNPKVCISFFWPGLERQIIIKGKAEKVEAITSDNYFNSRPEGSQLGAIVSNQSEIIASRDELEQKLSDLEAKLPKTAISRPANWGGYIVKPIEMEFWQGRPNRLHDRIRYQLKTDFNWKIARLAP